MKLMVVLSKHSTKSMKPILVQEPKMYIFGEKKCDINNLSVI